MPYFVPACALRTIGTSTIALPRKTVSTACPQFMPPSIRLDASMYVGMQADMLIQSAAMDQTDQVRWSRVVGARSALESAEAAVAFVVAVRLEVESTVADICLHRCAFAALEEFAVAGFAEVVVIFDDYFSAREDGLGLAFDFPAFEQAVVAVHVVGLGADRALSVGVEDDDVGVGADGDRAFPREHAEHLGACGGTEIDPFVQTEAALDDGAVVHHGQAVFDPGPPVWDLGEIAAAEFFLAFEVEGAVVGADFLEVAELEAFPKRFDVFLSDQRRGEDVLCAFEVGLVV